MEKERRTTYTRTHIIYNRIQALSHLFGVVCLIGKSMDRPYSTAFPSNLPDDSCFGRVATCSHLLHGLYEYTYCEFFFYLLPGHLHKDNIHTNITIP